MSKIGNQKLLECITFFNELKVHETDITPSDKETEGYKIVKVQYSYKNEKYTTKELYYRRITEQDGIKDAASIENYFNGPVYWLDIKTHQWPHGPGAEIEKTVIEDMIDGEGHDFESFLKRIANNNKKGFLQLITIEGRSTHYGFNLTNNNHWHDLIKLIQLFIKYKGEVSDKTYFKNLVFNWQDSERVELHSDRKIIKCLSRNLRDIQSILNQMETIEVLKSKGQVILQGPPGTGKTYTAKDIAEQLIFGNVSDTKKEQKERLEGSDQFALVQFHPSYSYEDFVRGITVKSNENQIEYITENKIIAEFSERAYNNFLKQEQKSLREITKKEWVEKKIFEFADIVQKKVEEHGEYEINETAFITEVNSEAFRYTGRNKTTKEPWSVQPNNMKFSDIIKGFLKEVDSRAEFKEIEDISGLAKQHASYYYRMLEQFRDSIREETPDLNGVVSPQLKKYVLIIDEINRANLPSVLGELIYALEYRNEPVQSIYAIDGNKEIIIPENLYIIGTMNTADRSIGHIDYAIKRRFAFIEMLPDRNIIKNEKAKDLFDKVSALFTKENENKLPKYLASDFNKKDVHLGHSYFLAKDDKELKLKFKYEILPILNEYIKDGILLENAKDYIETNLENFVF